MSSAEATLDPELARWIRGWWLRSFITLAALLGGAIASLELLTCARMAWGAWRLPGAMEELRAVNPPKETSPSADKEGQPWCEAVQKYQNLQEAGAYPPHSALSEILRSPADLDPGSVLRKRLADSPAVFELLAQPRQSAPWVRTSLENNTRHELGVIYSLERHNLRWRHRVMNRLFGLMQLLEARVVVAGFDGDTRILNEMTDLFEWGRHEFEVIKTFAGQEWSVELDGFLRMAVLNLLKYADQERPTEAVLLLLREVILRQIERPSSMADAVKGQRRMEMARRSHVALHGLRSMRTWVGEPFPFILSTEWFLTLYILMDTGPLDREFRKLEAAIRSVESRGNLPRFASRFNPDVSWGSPFVSILLARDRERFLASILHERIYWRVILAALDSFLYYRLNGVWPQDAGDLGESTPARLDPFSATGQNLRLSVRSDGELGIWSVGPDQMDDGFVGDDIGVRLAPPAARKAPRKDAP